MNPLLLTLHLLGSSSFAYAIYYDVYVLDLPEHIHSRRESFGGQAKYLTFLNMCLQFIFFTLCILADFSGKKSKLKRIKDVVFASAAFPIGVFVAVIFWGLYALDRELIFPQKLDGHFPDWLNHLMHTTVLPLQLGELYLASHVYPGRMLGGCLNSVLTVGYLVWLNVIFYYGGFWVYPVFKVLSATMRPVFMMVCMAMGFAFYILGEKLNDLIWENKKNSNIVSSKASQQKKLKKQRKEH